MIGNIIKVNKRIFMLAAFTAVFIACMICAKNAFALDIITLHVGDTYTVDSERTLGDDDFLNANWYSMDSSVMEIVGQNYNRETCEFKALTSSAGQIVTVYVEFQYYLDEYPYVPGVYTDRLYYYFKVEGDPPESMTIPETAQITDSSSITLTPTVFPADAEAICTWSSSDTSVATVDQNGVVRGVSKGTAVITAESVNGITSSCTVTVLSSHACGDDLEWSYLGGLLTISGTGEMYDYSDDAPWQMYSSDITDIIVTDGVTSIGSYAFAGTAASSVTLPESLVSIGEEAFAGCENLEDIYIPGKVSSIGSDAFSAYNLKSISVSPENAHYSSHDGIMFNKAQTTLIRYPMGRAGDDYVIPEYVRTISYAAFYNTKLKTLYVPKTVTSIEYYGISTMGLTVYGFAGSMAERAVQEYNDLFDEPNIYFEDITDTAPMLVSLGNVTGEYSDTVYLPVILSGNTGFANLNIEISYDNSVLKLKSAENENFGALYTGGADMSSGIYNMSWDSAENITYNGTIATLGFEIIDPDFSGRTPVGISFYKGLDGTYTDGYDMNFDESFNSLVLKYMNGSVAFSAFADTITLDNIIQDNGLSLTAMLSSQNGTDGIIIAALYDENRQLTAVKLYDAADIIDITFNEGIEFSEIAVFWFDSMTNMQPQADAVRIFL